MLSFLGDNSLVARLPQSGDGPGNPVYSLFIYLNITCF